MVSEALRPPRGWVATPAGPEGHSFSALAGAGKGGGSTSATTIHANASDTATSDPRPSFQAAYWLFGLAEVEGRCVEKLLFCQISCELRLRSNLDLIHGHGNQLVADTEDPARGEDHCRYRRMAEIN